MGKRRAKQSAKPYYPKELCERINFLYQACHVSAITRPLSANDGVCAAYGALLKYVAERAVVKLDTSVKRSLCAICGQLLLPGTSATCRIKRGQKGKPQFVMRCLRCRNAKKYVCDPKYDAGDNKEEKVEPQGITA